jgi:hypothetical protein
MLRFWCCDVMEERKQFRNSEVSTHSESARVASGTITATLRHCSDRSTRGSHAAVAAFAASNRAAVLRDNGL